MPDRERSAGSEPTDVDGPPSDELTFDTSAVVAQIECLDSESENRVPVATEGVTIGRDPQCDLVVEGRLFPQVSARHVRVRIEEDGIVVVEDLSSKNGTLLDGRLVQVSIAQIGQIVQLGNQGPRFRVVGPNGERSITATVSVHELAASELMAQAQLSAAAAAAVVPPAPEANPNAGSVAPTSQSGVRPLMLTLGFLVAAILGAIGWQQWSGSSDPADPALDKLEAKLSALESRLNVRSGMTDAELAAIGQELNTTGKELTMLQGRRGAGMVQDLEKELADLRREFERANQGTPSNSEVMLASVRPAVVRVEVQIQYRDRNSQKLLFEEGEGDFNLAERGSPVRLYRFGSGFCIDGNGSLVTNHHVIAPPNLDFDAKGFRVDPEIDIKIRFSGDQKERVARKVSSDSEHDLAILAVEPFGEIPVIPGFAVERDLPTPGKKVWLIAFPYGEFSAASVFEGVVSNADRSSIQVTTGVYKATSGGVLVDGAGRVLGVAQGRFQDPRDGTAEPRLGFCIPIARLAKIWPVR